jgi:hypothetical protein
LRKLDAEIAVVFLFFTSVDLGTLGSLVRPKGIPRDHYDDYYPDRYGRRHLVTVPYYSTDLKDFLILEERVKSWHAELYLTVLAEQGLDELAATLEQKCKAALRARASASPKQE